jgi:hypothetical protein
MTNQEQAVLEYIKQNQPVMVSDPKFTLAIGVTKNRLSTIVSSLNKQGLLSHEKIVTGRGMAKSIQYRWSVNTN